MATVLYLRDTKSTGIGVYRDLLAAAGSSAATGVVNTVASGTEIQWTKVAAGELLTFISGRAPVGGFTLAGQMTFSIWGHESNAKANCGGRLRIFKRTATEVETEIGGGPWNKGVEYTTSAREDVWTGTPTSTAFAEDDRLILKVYITNVGTMGGGYTCTLTYNAAGGATGDSFLQLTETVAFKAEPPPDDRGRMSWGEIETPTAPRRGRASFAEVETPTTPRRGLVSWSEAETPTAPRWVQDSFVELEAPTAPRRGCTAWGEFQTPDVARRGLTGWAELETPVAPRFGRMSFTEAEAPEAPRRAELAWSEAEVSLAPRRASLSWLELQTTDAPRLARLSFVEFEGPTAPRVARSSFAELEAPTSLRGGRLCFAELQAPSPMGGEVRLAISWVEFRTPDLGKLDHSIWHWSESSGGSR